VAKAIALLSGGLDSTLAILTVLKQGIEVRAIRFVTPFDCNVSDGASSLKDPLPLARRFGFDIETCHPGDRFLDMVKKPKHGYGKNMNPCIDCRIFMLNEAREMKNKTGADFIITGEVPGQRPMSQKRDMLYHIDKEAGVTDYVLRPLCAKLLRVTIPEQKGIIDRELLHDLSGRSRKPQMLLAKDFGLEEYPAPAGGCLLTEPNFSRRFKELLAHNPSPALKDIELLKIGRHFRFSRSCKIIVGRDKEENDKIESLSADSDCLLKVEDYGSPLAFISGEVTGETIKAAASICARYSGGKNVLVVEVSVMRGSSRSRVKVFPGPDEILTALRI
jgi:tRNA-uridine 2-sulfurtransferase